MELEKTARTLRLAHLKYSDILLECKKDLKPRYFATKVGGYSYSSFRPEHKDFIYQAIHDLWTVVSDSTGPFCFDIEYHYITEQNAFIELKCASENIFEDLQKLKSLEKLYQDGRQTLYPLASCIAKYEEINQVLQQVLSSDEVRSFEKPNELNEMGKEIEHLKFREYWRGRKAKYVLHLLLFIPFLASIFFVIIKREDKELEGLSKNFILFLGAIITIIFNLGFNNHSSFKNSWKLILPSTRKKLKESERNFFNSLP